jgi:arginine exporter protein ArgO
VAQSTVDAPSLAAPAAGEEAARAEPWTLRLFVRTHPWWSTAIAVGVLSLVLTVWARTRPGFDPYGWLVWGQQTVRASLDTNAAPSWKPLPYLFTAPFAVVGHYQVWLWMVTSLAVSLSGVVFAGRIAYRLVGGEPGRRYAAIAAAVFAGLGVLGISDYSHYMLSAQSDPMIVALCLGAIDCHLGHRYRWAFALGALASLGRPEVWPFFGLYAIWAWRTIPSMRRLIAGGIAVLLVLWFGIPALTSRSPFVAGTNALGSGRALHSDKVFGTVRRFLDLHAAPLEIVALLSAGLALWRRDRTTIALAAGVVAWVVLEIAFALHGWPGLPRYMFEASAVTVVIAAVGVGRLLADAPKISPPVGWAGIALVVVICASLVPTALSRERTEHKDLLAQRKRTSEIGRLTSTISGLGGAARLRACGEPLTRLEYQTILAWQLRVNVAKVGFKYSQAIHRGNPIVLYTPTHAGWKIQAFHQRLASCRSLPR